MSARKIGPVCRVANGQNIRQAQHFQHVFFQKRAGHMRVVQQRQTRQAQNAYMISAAFVAEQRAPAARCGRASRFVPPGGKRACTAEHGDAAGRAQRRIKSVLFIAQLPDVPAPQKSLQFRQRGPEAGDEQHEFPHLRGRGPRLRQTFHNARIDGMRRFGRRHKICVRACALRAAPHTSCFFKQQEIRLCSPAVAHQIQTVHLILSTAL